MNIFIENTEIPECVRVSTKKKSKHDDINGISNEALP